MSETEPNDPCAASDIILEDELDTHTFKTSPDTGTSHLTHGTELDDGGRQPESPAPTPPRSSQSTVAPPPTRPAPPAKRVNIARKTVPGYQGSKTVPGKGKGKTHIPTSVPITRISKTDRAGLIFAVPRIRGCLKRGRYAERITDTAAVYLTAVLEYLIAELLELSGNAAHQLNRKRISPRHVSLAARNDEEFVRLVPTSVIFPEGGFVPVLGFVQKDAPRLLVESGAPRKKSR